MKERWIILTGTKRQTIHAVCMCVVRASVQFCVPLKVIVLPTMLVMFHRNGWRWRRRRRFHSAFRTHILAHNDDDDDYDAGRVCVCVCICEREWCVFCEHFSHWRRGWLHSYTHCCCAPFDDDTRSTHYTNTYERRRTYVRIINNLVECNPIFSPVLKIAF